MSEAKPLTEIEIEGLGIMRHLNDWETLRARRIANRKNREIAFIAFGLGMTVQLFKKLSPEMQQAARQAFYELTDPSRFVSPPSASKLRQEGPRPPRLYERLSIERQIDLGQRLLAAKASLPHGHFRVWIEDEAGISYCQAQRWMRAAKEAERCGHDDHTLEAA